MNVLGAALSCLLLASALAALAAGASLAEPSPSAHRLRITGGGSGPASGLPYQVALLDQNALFCSGAVLSESWILTSGTCVDRKTGQIEVRAGLLNLNANDAQSVLTTAADRTIHPHYEPEFLDNDIALIKLPTPLTLGAKVAAIDLPTYANAAQDLVGETVLISGWGKTSDADDATIATTLQIANVKIVANSVCEAQFGNKIIGTKLCLDTSVQSGVRAPSPCDGDAGGPVVYASTDGISLSKTLHGIVSFGVAGECTVGRPFVFTRVSSFLEFIETVTGIPVLD